MRSDCPSCGKAVFRRAPGPARCDHCGKGFTLGEAAGPGAQPAPDPHPGDASPCARHPANPAERPCSRCGDFLCEVCSTPLESRHVCVKCFEYLEDHGELATSRAAFNTPAWSFWLGLLTLALGWFNCIGVATGPTAVGLGIAALNQIRRQPGLPGRGKAIAGIILGGLGFALTIAITIYQIRDAIMTGVED